MKQLSTLRIHIVAIVDHLIKDIIKRCLEKQYICNWLKPIPTKDRKKGNYFLVDLFREAIYGEKQKESFHRAMKKLDDADLPIVCRLKNKKSGTKQNSSYIVTEPVRVFAGSRRKNRRRRGKPTQARKNGSREAASLKKPTCSTFCFT